MDINVLSFKEKFELFLNVYYKILGKTFTYEDFAVSIKSTRKSVFVFLQDFDNATDNMFYKFYYYFKEQVNFEIIKGTEFQRSLEELNESILSDLTGEINRRLSNYSFESERKKEHDR